MSPETSDWHYVEGLRIDDDPRLALFWDKTGLGHNGQRLSDGVHIVTFIDGARDHITADAWPMFLEKQNQLLSALKHPR